MEESRDFLFSVSQFPKHHRRSGCHIQGIDTVVHRNTDHIIRFTLPQICNLRYDKLRKYADIRRYMADYKSAITQDSFFSIYPVTQLGICQGSEHFHSGVFQRCYFDDRHESLLFLPKLRKKTRPYNDFFPTFANKAIKNPSS